MFEDLRNAFREALDNFKEELNRDTVTETADRFLKGMVDEVTGAKARLQGIREDLAVTRKQVTAEADAVETNRRRLRMAREIEDEETARLAEEQVHRHEKRLEVFRRKEEALAQEETLLDTEVEEMILKLKEARERRASLAAEAGRTGAREAMAGADDLFDALNRMEERITGHEAEAEAARGFGEEFGSSGGEPPRSPEADVDARLEELKRRMGKE